jgi:hypothetical protein
LKYYSAAFGCGIGSSFRDKFIALLGRPNQKSKVVSVRSKKSDWPILDIRNQEPNFQQTWVTDQLLTPFAVPKMLRLVLKAI